MTYLATAAFNFKLAMYDAAGTLWAGTSVQRVLGAPTMYQSDEIVEFGAVSSSQEPASFGTRREREETLTLEVVISEFQAGDRDIAELAVFTRCYERLAELAEYVRVTDTTLGGAVRQCFLTDQNFGSGDSVQTNSQGRVGVIVATFTAQARITS